MPLTEPDGILGGSPGPVRGYRAVVRRELERFLAIRHTGDVLLGGASGAGSLLLNTKASQEAACSRAPAAIAPGPEPELRDAGVSRFTEIGSHLAEVDGAESHAGQVDDPGCSRNAGTGLHLEVAPVTDAVGVHVSGPGSSEFTKNGSHLTEVNAAESSAGRVGGPGSSEFTKNDSHLEAEDVAEGLPGGWTAQVAAETPE